MSRLETLMSIGLGFAAGCLVSLIAGRLLWIAVNRYMARKRQKNQPAQLLELTADRDRLRAEYAMLSRKLELRLDELKTRLAEQMSELSRNRNRAETMMEEIRKRDAALQSSETDIKALNDQVSRLETEASNRAGRIAELERELAEKGNLLVTTSITIAGLNAEISQRDQELARLNGSAVGASAGGPAGPEMPTANARLTQRIEALTAMSQEIAVQRAEIAEEREQLTELAQGPVEPQQRLANLTEQSRTLEEKLAAAERESEELANELKKLDLEWSARLGTPGGSAPAPVETPKSGASGKIANVISLAARIKALKSDIAG